VQAVPPRVVKIISLAALGSLPSTKGQGASEIRQAHRTSQTQAGQQQTGGEAEQRGAGIHAVSR